MSSVDELYTITKNLYEVTFSDSNNDIENQIKEITSILEIREQLLVNITDKFINEEDRVKINRITEMDIEINEQFRYMSNTLKHKLSNIKKTKGTQQKYLNPYSQIKQASRFFDKKK